MSACGTKIFTEIQKEFSSYEKSSTYIARNIVIRTTSMYMKYLHTCMYVKEIRKKTFLQGNLVTCHQFPFHNSAHLLTVLILNWKIRIFKYPRTMIVNWKSHIKPLNLHYCLFLNGLKYARKYYGIHSIPRNWIINHQMHMATDLHRHPWKKALHFLVGGGPFNMNFNKMA